jgi:hypothetical protein
LGALPASAALAGGETSVTTEPLLLVADLLYALGWSLWTGVVVVFFVQIWPEAKPATPWLEVIALVALVIPFLGWVVGWCWYGCRGCGPPATSSSPPSAG